MILQAQMHQGQSHFSTVATRPQDPDMAQVGSSDARRHQQPWTGAVEQSGNDR